jgi:IS5 family transposase
LAHADLEGIMAHRRIGQEVFRFGAKAGRETSLDGLGGLINWPVADRILAPLYPAVKGEKAWPPLAMFKALLLATRYDLSDAVLAEALSDRASFRRFCGFSRDTRAHRLRALPAPACRARSRPQPV